MQDLDSLRDFSWVMETYSNMLLRIACHHVKSRTEAEDIVQETFVKLITTHPFLESEEHRKAWLIRVTINLCKNFLKSSRRKEIPLADPYYQMSPDQQEVLDAVWRLPEKFRDAVYLYYYEGYTVPEISRLLEKKENTVASWLHRARKRLKEELTGGVLHE